MMTSYKLSGGCTSELNTELRFVLAGARVDGDELIRIVLPETSDEREEGRVKGCLIKVLRTLKKENVIQFYVNHEGFALNTTQAVFLQNKYSEYISNDDSNVIYIKL